MPNRTLSTRYLAALLDARLTAACRLERAHQIVREHGRYGFPVTQQHLAHLADAESAYDRATARLGR